ncbi:BET3 family protein [Pisolithus croceorrhizus]|nr:BET3 family protein [Pisolithus croceorrhizus]
MATPSKQYKAIGEDLWKSRTEKVNAELFALTYGALVVQLIQDYEDYGEGGASDFREVGEVVAKVGFKSFLNITPGRPTSVQQQTSVPTSSFTLTLDENPLAEFVELPEEALEGGLWFSNVLCGVLRGALEMVQMQVQAEFLSDVLARRRDLRKYESLC